MQQHIHTRQDPVWPGWEQRRFSPCVSTTNISTAGLQRCIYQSNYFYSFEVILCRVFLFMLSNHGCNNQFHSSTNLMGVTFCVDSRETNFRTEGTSAALGTVSRFDSSFIKSCELLKNLALGGMLYLQRLQFLKNFQDICLARNI